MTHPLRFPVPTQHGAFLRALIVALGLWLLFGVHAHAASTPSISVSPNPVQPEQPLTVKMSLNPALAANATTVTLWFYTTAGQYVGAGSTSNVNFRIGQATPVTVTYALPSTLSRGTYTFNLSIYQSGSRTGLWGLKNAATFTVGPAQALASCTFDGQSIPSGSSVTAYSAASVAVGQSCASQTRSCSNGQLSGTYAYASCTPAAVAGGIKWHPGHYAWLDPGTSRDAQFTAIEALSNDSTVKGFQLLLPWAQLEGAPGDYTAGFELVDAYLTEMASLKVPKRLILGVEERKFGTPLVSGTPCGIAARGLLPAYLASYNEGGCAIALPGAAGSLAVVARFWEPAVMDRLIALSRAYAQRYDAHPLFEMFLGNGETAVAAPPGSGFSNTAYAAQLKRWFDASKLAWEHTQLRLAANWLGSDSDMEDLIGDVTANGGVIVGGPDPELPLPAIIRTVQSNQLFRAARGYGPDFRQIVPWVGEVQAIGLGARYTQLPSELFNYDYNTMHASYMIWMMNSWTGGSAQRWSTGELPFIHSINGLTHSECPLAYENRCSSSH